MVKEQKKDPCELEIINFGLSLIEKLLTKYQRGREEHGSNWQGVNCVKEMNEEILDIINYHCIHKAQQYGKRTVQKKRKR